MFSFRLKDQGVWGWIFLHEVTDIWRWFHADTKFLHNVPVLFSSNNGAYHCPTRKDLKCFPTKSLNSLRMKQKHTSLMRLKNSIKVWPLAVIIQAKTLDVNSFIPLSWAIVSFFQFFIFLTEGAKGFLWGGVRINLENKYHAQLCITRKSDSWSFPNFSNCNQKF